MSHTKESLHMVKEEHKENWKKLQTLKKMYEEDEKMKSYLEDERFLEELIKKYPKNDEYTHVYNKVCNINARYSAGVGPFDMRKMAIYLTKCENFDSLLEKGKPEAVDMICNPGKYDSKSGIRSCYKSFATKYCSFHQPDKYYIYDSHVHKELCKYLPEKKARLEEWAPKKGARLKEIDKKFDYKEFAKILLGFIKKFINPEKLSTEKSFKKKYFYKEVDKYLWYYHKLYTISERKIIL